MTITKQLYFLRRGSRSSGLLTNFSVVSLGSYLFSSVILAQKRSAPSSPLMNKLCVCSQMKAAVTEATVLSPLTAPRFVFNFHFPPAVTRSHVKQRCVAGLSSCICISLYLLFSTDDEGSSYLKLFYVLLFFIELF